MILASASPRRRQLLQQIGYEPECIAAEIDEQARSSEPADALVRRLARSKAMVVWRSQVESQCRTQQLPAGPDPAPLIIVGADTVIELDGDLLGKPLDRRHGLAMLQRLSGREHSVFSGVCVITGDAAASCIEPDVQQLCVRTRVRFGQIAATQAEAYWDGGEPAGKAGGYAIQGAAAQFVAHLSGSYSNVVGLPLYETHALLARALSSADPPA
ncbi:MAG: septum formation protein Maf [Granulosicoccus sp.]|nr:septum formation protein Maf [Granulosicoccus sp.]